MQTFKPQMNRSLNMEWDGEQIKVRFPKTDELMNHRSKMKEIEGDEEKVIEEMFGFLSELGLKREIASKLDAIDLTQLLKILGGTTEKK